MTRMNVMNARLLALAALCTASGYCFSMPIEMIVDPAQSSIDLTIEIDVAVGSDTDSDSSPLSGTLSVELDDYGNPTQITLHDLFINIDNTLNFNWSFGFFGGADAMLSNGAVTWGATDAPVGPVPIVGGAFVLPEVPIFLQGMMAVNYDIFIVGSGSEIIDLAEQDGFFTTIDGSVAVDGSVVTLNSIIPIDATSPIEDEQGNQLGTLTVSGIATIVATAQAPACPADLTGDGVLDFFDISAFLNAFNAMDPIADFDGNGKFDFFDVSGFLNAFTAGCP